MPDRAAFVTVCGLAGALALPLHPIVTPLAAAATGLLGLFGLRVWRWSGLTDAVRAPGARGLLRVIRIPLWLGIGLAAGLVILLVLRLALEPSVPAIGARISAAGATALWMRAIIIYVAAVTEELVFRLLVLSVVAGVGARLLRTSGHSPTPAIAWAAIVVAALAFAAVHLPSWSSSMPLSAGLAASVLALNAAGGLLLGHVFVTRGITAAIWTHAGADCAIQIIGPMTGPASW